MPQNKSKNERKSERVGERRMMNCGMEAEIICYKDNHHINVKFSDGTIVADKTYQRFQKGQIGNPNLEINRSNISRESNKIGEKRIMSCGLEAEIIAYRKSTDIDVRFSDEIIVTCKRYCNFAKGHIGHPNIEIRGKAGGIKSKYERIGEKRVMNCGLEAEIIAYRNYDHIDVRFYDGTIVTNKRYGNFIKGKIRHPNLKPSNRLEEKKE